MFGLTDLAKFQNFVHYSTKINLHDRTFKEQVSNEKSWKEQQLKDDKLKTINFTVVQAKISKKCQAWLFRELLLKDQNNQSTKLTNLLNNKIPLHNTYQKCTKSNVHKNK